jgi:hypothetical protein
VLLYSRLVRRRSGIGPAAFGSPVLVDPPLPTDPPAPVDGPPVGPVIDPFDPVDPPEAAPVSPIEPVQAGRDIAQTRAMNFARNATGVERHELTMCGVLCSESASVPFREPPPRFLGGRGIFYGGVHSTVTETM